ncbi:MAG: hypothetical protein MPW15_27775 [Candidatus Manganitrophus sp.]|nr:hypothetical protein [Candidatus Manganitrophus sp.]
MNPAIVIKGKSRSKEYFIPVLPAPSPTSLRRRQGAILRFHSAIPATTTIISDGTPSGTE